MRTLSFKPLGQMSPSEGGPSRPKRLLSAHISTAHLRDRKAPRSFVSSKRLCIKEIEGIAYL
jgi:hypothetical protein